MVVFFGGGDKHAPEGLGLAYFANRLGTLERAERYGLSTEAFSFFCNSR
jgi:hypothetical protein